MRAVYPGSFDPVTNGHLDLIERGSQLFEALVVAVAVNPGKEPLFTVGERLEMLRELVDGRLPNVSVDAFSGLVVDYARKKGLGTILRGLRTVSDFEYEFQMALTNRSFDSAIETVFVMPSLEYAYISSRLIKESVIMGADVSHMLPPVVEARLRKKLGLRPIT
ncbi:MAG: pantetheine-phosphate adenylyltransferase [Planctomycetota bacterium]